MADFGPVFQALYPGDCGDCGFDVEGDQVRYVDGEIWHEGCAESEVDDVTDVDDLMGE